MDRLQAPRRLVDQTLPKAPRQLRANGQVPSPFADVLVAIPAYNESRFIGSIVLQALPLGCPVLVIDDGSTDETAAIAAAAGAVVERHNTNLGKVEALNTAFAFARESGAAALVIVDGDGQHDVSAIPRLVAPVLAGAADMVIGSRFLKSSAGSTPAVRRLGQRWLTVLANTGSGVPVTDSQSGFRAFSQRAVQTLTLQSQGFGAEVELQFRAREQDLTVVEVPIRAIYQDPPKRNVFGQGIEVLNRVLNLTGRHRPLMSFALLAGLLLALGLGAAYVAAAPHGSWAADGAIAQISTVLEMAAVISLFTGFVLHALRGNSLELQRGLHGARGAGPRRRYTDHIAATETELTAVGAAV